jgi:hypothetical protein
MYDYVYLYNFESKKPRIRAMPELDQESLTEDRTIFTTDAEIQKIQRFTIKDTPEHREWCFWVESECQTFARMLASIIVGSGIKIMSDNKKAVEIITKFNNNINLSGQTIHDFIENSLIDSLIHGFYCWRIYPTKELDTKIDISRVNPKTIVPVYGVHRSFVKYIQSAYVHTQEPKTKKSFNSKTYNPNVNYEDKSVSRNPFEMVYIHIPKESTISSVMFQKPPMAAAMTYVVFKRLILYYMRKSAQKYWTPLLIGKYGSEEYLPMEYTNPNALKTKLDDLRDTLLSAQNFNAIAVPNYVEIDALKMQREVKDFVAELEYLNGEIVFSLLGSIVLRPRTQQPIRQSQMNENMFYSVIKYLRAKYVSELMKLYKLVLKYNKIDAELKLRWSALKEDSNTDVVTMASMIMEQEGFKDFKEYRQFLSMAFEWMDDVTDKEAKEMKKRKDERFNRKYQLKASIAPVSSLFLSLDGVLDPPPSCVFILSLC